MLSILTLGFLIGIRHAFEADHVAAVSTLATRQLTMGQTLKQGVAWGVGHTVTLFLFGSVVLYMNTIVPEQLAGWLEFAVGIMLLALGADVLRRMIRDRIHFHTHYHGAGLRHFHAHSHRGQPSGAHPARHSHDHVSRFPVRALLIGLMHGMAGSAALILLTLQNINAPLWGMFYILIFGIGSIMGMAAVSFAVALPLRGARSLTWMHNTLQGLIGTATVILGIVTITSVGFG